MHCDLCDREIRGLFKKPPTAYWTPLPEGSQAPAGNVCRACYTLIQSAEQAEEDHNPQEMLSCLRFSSALEAVQDAMRAGYSRRADRGAGNRYVAARTDTTTTHWWVVDRLTGDPLEYRVTETDAKLIEADANKPPHGAAMAATYRARHAQKAGR